MRSIGCGIAYVMNARECGYRILSIRFWKISLATETAVRIFDFTRAMLRTNAHIESLPTRAAAVVAIALGAGRAQGSYSKFALHTPGRDWGNTGPP